MQFLSEPNNSFEKRRKLMKEVEHIIAEAEATVGKKENDDDDENQSSSDDSNGSYEKKSVIHVSDVSSDDFDNDYERFRRDLGNPMEVSIMFSVDSDVSSSLHSPCGDSDNNRDEDQKEEEEKEEDVHKDPTIPYPSSNKNTSNYAYCGKVLDMFRMPTPITSGNSKHSDNKRRSLNEEIHLEKNGSGRKTTDPNPLFSQTKSSSSIVPPPQDRSSVASKPSVPSSAATPAAQYIHNHDPILSPPFIYSSPRPTKSSSNTKNVSTSTSRRSKITRKKTVISSNSKAFDEIFSPQRSKSPSYKVNETSHHSYSYHDDYDQDNSMFVNEMKQEIEKLKAQFQKLDKESRRHRGDGCNVDNDKNNDSLHYDPQALFEKDISIMNQKTNAMADALHKNYARSDQLQQENDMLRDECDNLNMKLDKIILTTPDAEGVLNEYKENSGRKKSPRTLLKELDSSDDYVRRRYPPIPKTPGTMFTTEFVEVMKLDVGEHAYLAEILDRQWNTTNDFRP